MYQHRPLIWSNWSKRHIRKHRVTVKEVEEVYKSNFQELPTYGIRKLILGTTKRGRLLAVALSFEKQDDPYVVSARDMNKQEEHYFYVQTKAN